MTRIEKLHKVILAKNAHVVALREEVYDALKRFETIILDARNLLGFKDDLKISRDLVFRPAGYRSKDGNLLDYHFIINAGDDEMPVNLIPNQVLFWECVEIILRFMECLDDRVFLNVDNIDETVEKLRDLTQTVGAEK